MARKIDSNNLSAGDIVRLVAPTAISIVGLFLALHFFGKTGGLVAIVVIMIGVYIILARLPKDDAQRIGQKLRERDEKMYRVPVVGPLLGPLWKAKGWISIIVGLLVLGYMIGGPLF